MGAEILKIGEIDERGRLTGEWEFGKWECAFDERYPDKLFGWTCEELVEIYNNSLKSK